jgi:hypothetical protein
LIYIVAVAVVVVVVVRNNLIYAKDTDNNPTIQKRELEAEAEH